MKSILTICCAIIAYAISSCTNPPPPNIHEDFLTSNIDTSIKPGDDFFLYANGLWIKNNPIPADESSWGIGELVREENYKRLKNVNEKAIEENAAHGTVSQKIADFWKSGMDTISINAQRLQPLQDQLDEINKINSIADIIDIAA